MSCLPAPPQCDARAPGLNKPPTHFARLHGSNAAAGGGRYFGAQVRAGKLEITPDFGGDVADREDLAGAAFHDHNGRPIYL